MLIQEIQITNDSTLADEDGDYGDWIELYNSGSETVDLTGYGLSDNPENLYKWTFLSGELDAGQRRIVFASGKDRMGSIPTDHFETPVFPWSVWDYIVPSSEPPSNWNTPEFVASGWNEGPGGFGYADGDDGTDLGSGIVSVYARCTFQLSDASSFIGSILAMDYDDGFIAYLNGTEIARVNCGDAGSFFPYNAGASAEHEAAAYQNLPWDYFLMDQTQIEEVLIDGQNVLAIQFHNASAFSSDMTGNALLILNNSNAEIQTELAPEWLGLTIPPVPNYHTNFKLSTGETLSLTAPGEGDTQSAVLPAMQLDHVLQFNSGSWCVSAMPSPGDPNGGDCFSAYETAPFFGIESGVFSSGINLELTSQNPLAEIRYTLDGSIPDVDDMLYTSPIALDTTAVVSARCFSDNALPSAVEKNTYMINEWGIELPVVSVTTNPENLWDPENGIHVLGEGYVGGYPFFGSNIWEDWEREAYMEYFDANHIKQVEGPMGIKIHGGWSRARDQKSFRLQCKDEYGMEEINYPLIPDKPFLQSIKGFNLRNGGNDYDNYRFHDALLQRAFRETDVDYMAYEPVVVFLNGEYWGIMELREVQDQHYIEDNHGIDNDDVTVISSNYLGWNIISGNDASFYAMYNAVMNADPESDSFYGIVDSLIDIENYCDYIIAETYWGNGDWYNGWNNTKFWHDDRPGGKWNFMLMDMDFGTWGGYYDDYLNIAANLGTNLGQLFDRINKNEQFREYFINRYADIINYHLEDEKFQTMGYVMRDEVIDSWPRHCQRWFTDCGTFDWLLDARVDWNEQRRIGARDVVQTHYNLLDQVSITLDVVPEGAGRIHISTVEPREDEYPWTGVYYNGIPVRITVVANPGFTFDHWGANGIFPVPAYLDQFIMNFEDDEIFTAFFTGVPIENAMQVSEFMYNPDGAANCGDWLELHNTLDVDLDLSGMYIKDANYFNKYEIPLNTTLEPGEFLVIAADTSLFAQQYPNVENVIGPLDFSLSNGGDQIRVFDFHNTPLIEIHYLDESPWPANTDGTGRTNEFDLTATDQNLAINWFGGCIGGSPAQAYDPNCGLVSTEETNRMDVIGVYPNPVREMLQIVLPNSEERPAFEILDMSGRVVLVGTLMSAANTLSLSDLAPGLYALRIYESNGTFDHKFMKE
ncbi:MAG: CotH kinase family protein [Flavobacteriales bacterium]